METSSLLGAACLGQPYQVPIYMRLCRQNGKASSRPGAGWLGPIISLYMLIQTYKGETQAAGLGLGCLTQPQHISIYVHTHM